MYGKVFSSIFNSTLVADGGWLPTYIFMSMIAIADKDGVVDVAPKALFRKLGFREYDSKVDFNEFQKAIEYLQTEDPESNSPAENGRRIIPMSETDVGGNRGWLIVNYMEYRKKASKEEPKGASTERVRRFRDRNKNNALPEVKRNETDGNGEQRQKEGHTDTDRDTDLNNIKEAALLALGDSKYKTMKTFLDLCKQAGVKPIPEDDAAWKYAEKMKITPDMVKAAWYRFKNKYRGDKKRYIDWRKAFLNALRDNWYKIWWFDANGHISWTSAGQQALLAMKNDAEADL